MENSEILEVIKASENKPAKALNAWLLLGASLLAFAAMGMFQWDLEYLVLLAVAIFLHELGHLLAMKLFHYKNLKMLFLPFFGGVATGESKERNATKIALICLFGPLAGLASCYAALGLWCVFPADLLVTYAYLSLFINAFNLLPIMPLDGGQILNETLFSRFPITELIYKIIAVIGLGLLAYFLHSWIFGLLAVFIFMGLGFSYKFAQAASRLRAEEGMTGGELTVEKVGRIRQEFYTVNPHFENEKHIGKLPGTINSTWLRVNKTFPSSWVTIGLLAAYGATFFGGSIVTLLAIYRVTGITSIPK